MGEPKREANATDRNRCFFRGAGCLHGRGANGLEEILGGERRGGEKRGRGYDLRPAQSGLSAGLGAFSKNLSRDQVQLRSRQRLGSRAANRGGAAGRKISRRSTDGRLVELRGVCAGHSGAAQAAAAFARGRRSIRLVRRQILFCRCQQRGTDYFRRDRHAPRFLQHQAGRAQGDSILVGLAATQVERQARELRPAGGRRGRRDFPVFLLHTSLGRKFITRFLTKTDVLRTRDLQQGTDWLASGKVHFYTGSGQPIMKAKKQGWPVDLMPHALKEG